MRRAEAKLKASAHGCRLAFNSEIHAVYMDPALETLFISASQQLLLYSGVRAKQDQ